MEQFLARVAVENVAYHFDILYTYIISPEFCEKAVEGVRVRVPFGRGTSERQGFIFEVVKGEPDRRMKKISCIIDEKPLLSREMIEIALFLKDRTFCTYYEAAKVQLPAGFSLRTNITYVAVPNENETELSKSEKYVYDIMRERAVYMSRKDIFDVCGLADDSTVLERLISKGFVARNYETVSKIGNLSVKNAALAVDDGVAEEMFESLTEKQKRVVKTLLDTGSVSVKELCYFTGVTPAVITTLEKKGVVSLREQDVFRIPQTYGEKESAKREINLTEKQTKVYKSLCEKYANGGGVSLLYGITGSGKTSVFIKLIDNVLSDGKQVIVMVPEISLTAQMMAVFKSRYGSKVAIFHSALSMGERKDEYRRVRCGEAKIAVGTRSAVFAPFDNLGLIVMDEEQEHTYKSEASPRYHARDVAKFRAAYNKALLLLCSATPSIESYSMAKKGRYMLTELDERYGSAVLPEVSVVDLKNDRQRGNKYSLSIELQQLISANLENKKQTILLMNRRGYNTFAACDNCGETVSCPSCSISLTFHRANGRLMCHYCGYSTDFTIKCSHCGKERVRYQGYGTQRVEEELSKLYPEAKILRLDTDSAVSRQNFEKSISDFENGKYDIMLGTQMVAKGLNFENVTVVGVINADGQLYNDDYRSGELTFDLLTQVVGRSGRGTQKGVALIQTMTPENNIIRLAQKQDYEGFYNDEIEIRRALTYPPFCDICSFSTVSEDERKAFIAAKTLVEKMSMLLSAEYKELKVIVLSPMPPRISKMNNKFRYRTIIKCKNSRLFRQMISQLLSEFGKNKLFSDVTFTADINPENLC